MRPSNLLIGLAIAVGLISWSGVSESCDTVPAWRLVARIEDQGGFRVVPLEWRGPGSSAAARRTP